MISLQGIIFARSVVRNGRMSVKDGLSNHNERRVISMDASVTKILHPYEWVLSGWTMFITLLLVRTGWTLALLAALAVVAFAIYTARLTRPAKWRAPYYILYGVCGLIFIGQYRSANAKPGLESETLDSAQFAATDPVASPPVASAGKTGPTPAAPNNLAPATTSEQRRPIHPTAMTKGPFIYSVEYIQQLKLKWQGGFREDAIRDMMSNDLQVANLDEPLKVTIIDRCPDYTTVEIEEASPDLRARGFHFGSRMFIPNVKNW